MLTIFSILSMFCLLIICSFVFFWSKKLNMPYTVLLVLVGIVLVLVSSLQTLNPVFGFLTTFKLTPELLFFIFLPTLIFESAFNMNMRKIVDNIWSISILSIIGLLISTILISSALYFLLPLIGLNIPFIVLLLFASIISATDPVAVLALFKEYGAPKRLTLIFEGESLFNDGTAVALFLVVLAVAEKGMNGFQTVLGGIETFLMMIIFGTIFGLLVAMLFTKFLKYFKENEFVAILLLIISAHVIFILSELINTHPIFGFNFHISPIIATTVGALFLGNYAKHVLSPKNEEYLDKAVAHLAFVINSLVFILIGILFATTPLNFKELFLPILLTILVVAVARAVSVYSTIIPLNYFKLEKNIPRTWQHLLSWGSLRGALAIIIVLQIPDSFTISGWVYDFSVKDFLIAITSGCVLATIFIKATTIKKFMDYFNIYENNPQDKISSLNISLIYLLNEKKKLAEHIERKFIFSKNENSCDELIKELDQKISKIVNEKENLLKTYPKSIFINELKINAIKIEENYLKELYNNNEVSEKVYRRIKGKLNIQKEKHENEHVEEINSSEYIDKKDVFDKFINYSLSPFSKNRNVLDYKEQVEYYRTQTIISRKVIKNLTEINQMFDLKVFNQEILSNVLDLYEKYRQQSAVKLEKVISENKENISLHLEYLNRQAIKISGKKGLLYIYEKGLLSTTEYEHEIGKFQ